MRQKEMSSGRRQPGGKQVMSRRECDAALFRHPVVLCVSHARGRMLRTVLVSRDHVPGPIPKFWRDGHPSGQGKCVWMRGDAHKWRSNPIDSCLDWTPYSALELLMVFHVKHRSLNRQHLVSRETFADQPLLLRQCSGAKDALVVKSKGCPEGNARICICTPFPQLGSDGLFKSAWTLPGLPSTWKMRSDVHRRTLS